MNVLDEIVASTRQAVAARAARVPLSALKAAGEQRLAGPEPLRDFRGALAADGVSLIAEHKRSSPSAGLIRADLELADVVSAYERGGASALSVLTEESRFSGRLDDLGAARAASRLPILRKDFVVDPYQVHEALAAGADAILLIVAALEPGPLAGLRDLAASLGLAVLVEVHNERELATALDLEAEIIGVNNRNLSTLDVDVERTFALREQIPDGHLVVAESGLRERAQLERLATAGVDAALIGERLMRAPDIEAAARKLTGVHAPTL